MACLIRDEDIPACCIVNADQTQVVYSAGSGTSWTETGQRQVSILGAEEKRAFTLLVGLAMSGEVLPPQAIYFGKSVRSTPDPSSPGFLAAQNIGVRFLPAKSDSYWSTMDTMKDYVIYILAPFFIAQRHRHNLPDRQRCIFQIDCWSVHRSSDFRLWMAASYPWITLQYVPGGCTGLFQACDVGVQRILKLAIWHACHEDVVNETLCALEAGQASSDIVNDTRIKTLRNRSVRWIVEGYQAINNPGIVQKAFQLCAVPETSFNLSYASLTSREARSALLDLRSSDPAFYAEISSGASITLSIADAEDAEPAAGDEDLSEATVHGLCEALLAANTAAEVAALADTEVGNDEDDSEDDYEPVSGRQPTPPPIAAASRRSTRVRRLTRR